MNLTPPALRIKSQWFKPGVTRTAADHASAMAFIVFRQANHWLKRMRGAHFEIDAGPAYFAFLNEVLAFLVAVTDRLAHQRLDAEGRAEFTTALVRHLARTLAENERELLGPEPEGATRYEDRFIDLVNVLSGHYAEFGADAQAQREGRDFEPDFAFLRYLGHRLEPTLPEHDRRWVIDQVMAAEAPDAVATVQRSMKNLFEPSPRRARRASMSGE